MDPALQVFFEHLGPYLVRGEGDLSKIESVLGPLPDAERIRLYPEFVRNQHFAALEAQFPATERALRAWRKDGFRKAMEHHLSGHRCHGVHPSALGKAFPESLRSFAAREGAPSWAEELADQEWLLHDISSSPRPRPAVRWYDHDVYGFIRDPSLKVPRERHHGIIVARDSHERVKTLSATPLRLAALGWAMGELTVHDLTELGFPKMDVRAAKAELQRGGILDYAKDDGRSIHV